MKKQFDIKAVLRGGFAALIPTFLIVWGAIVAGRAKGPEPWGIALILCGLSFIFGMAYFGMKKGSEKDENQGD